MNHITKYLSLVFLSLLLVACFHEELLDDANEGDSGEIASYDETKFAESSTVVDVTAEEVKTAIKTSLKTGLNDGVYRMAEGIDSANSVSLALKARKLRNKPAYRALASPEMQRFMESRIARKAATRYGELSKVFPRENVDDEVEAIIDELFNDFLDAGVKDGNKFTYHVRDSICDGAETAEELADCQEVLEHVTIVITLSSETAGVLSIKYDDFVPLALGYSSDEWFIELSLTDISAIAKQLETDLALTADEIADMEMPDTLKGAVRVSMLVPDAYTVKTAFGVTEAIDVDYIDEIGEALYLDIAAAEISSATIDTNANTIETSTAMKAMSFRVHEVGDTASDVTDYEFAFAGATGKVTVDGNTDVIVATDVGLRDQPLTWDINNAHAVIVEMDTTSFEINTSMDDFSVKFNKGFSFDATVNNLEGEFAWDFFEDADNPEDPTLTIGLELSAPSGTVLGNSIDDRMRVDQGGPFVFVVTGHNAGSVTINAGECFTEQGDAFPTSETCAADI